MKKIAIVENETEAKLLSVLHDKCGEIKRLRAINAALEGTIDEFNSLNPSYYELKFSYYELKFSYYELKSVNADLLEALDECAEQLALLAKDPKNNPWVQQAYAAIAKATEPVRRERK